VYIPFLDTILEQLRFRFNEKTTFAGLFDTLLPTNCAKYGAVEEEFMQLYGNYSRLGRFCLKSKPKNRLILNR
jgi:hypothetical protein